MVPCRLLASLRYVVDPVAGLEEGVVDSAYPAVVAALEDRLAFGEERSDLDLGGTAGLVDQSILAVGGRTVGNLALDRIVLVEAHNHDRTAVEEEGSSRRIAAGGDSQEVGRVNDRDCEVVGLVDQVLVLDVRSSIECVLVLV